MSTKNSQKKFSSAPYQGLYGQAPMPQMMQPAAPMMPQTQPNAAQPAANQNAPMMPAQPSPTQQVQAMSGSSRQARGYGNTPLSQNAGQPGQPGRPPVGTKKTAGLSFESGKEMCRVLGEMAGGR